MNQEKIIQAISEYLDKETYFSETIIKDQKTRQFMRINVMQSHLDFCQEIAREIAAAIAPHLEAGAGVNVKVIVDLREKIGKVTRSIQRDRESTALEYCKKIDDILRLL